MRIRARHWTAVIAVVIVAAVAIVIWQVTRPTHTQYSLQLTPITPLTARACVSEARRYGYSAPAGAIVCRPGQGQSWYRAVLTNRGSYGLPACTATALDSRGRTVFTGALFFAIGGVRGLFVPGHGSTTFDWYLPRKARRTIARYTATCSPSSSPFAAAG